MTKSDKRIEIVRSPLSGLSSMSKASAASILSVLDNYFIDARITLIENLNDLHLLSLRSPDIVFLGTKYLPVESINGIAEPDKIWLSDFLDDHNIWHTGSSQAAYELEREKPLAKQRVLERGLSTSDFWVINKGQAINRMSLPINYPVFVKPTNKGGGFGIASDSVVNGHKQLETKVRQIHELYDSDALVENYLPGREFSVAVLEEFSGDYLALPIELIAPVDEYGSRLLSGVVKSSNTETVIRVSDKILYEKLTSFAIATFEALGANNYGRIDLRLDQFNEPCFLEANLMPSLISGYGSFPKACLLNMGLEFDAMIMKIMSLGLLEQDEELHDMALVI